MAPTETRATQGNPVLLGGGTATNDATTVTIIKNTTQGGTSIEGDAVNSGVGVFGYAPLGTGVSGWSVSSIGVMGQTTSETGVAGMASAEGKGVLGQSETGTGVVGVNTTTGATDATGVIGRAGDLTGAPTNTSEVGVYGYANSSTDAAGVLGQTLLGFGTVGTSTNGIGVFGSGPIGVNGDGFVGVYGTGRQGVLGDATPNDTGVYGWVGVGAPGTAPAGIAVHAAAEAAYTALNVVGKTKFSRSGRKAIAKGKSSLVVSLAGVTTSSYVIATLQTNRSGVWIRAAVPASGKFTIYLNKAVAASTYIGYLVDASIEESAMLPRLRRPTRWTFDRRADPPTIAEGRPASAPKLHRFIVTRSQPHPIERPLQTKVHRFGFRRDA